VISRKKENKKSISILLEEYRQLRAEIVLFLERRTRGLHLAIVITIGSIGIGVKWENPILFLTSSLLISFLWYDEIRRLRAIFRNSTYIEVFLEPELHELKWEKMIAKHKIQKSVIGRIIAGAEFPILYSSNAILGVFSILKRSIVLSIIVIVIYSIIFLILFIKEIILSYKGREKALLFWQKIK